MRHCARPWARAHNPRHQHLGTLVTKLWAVLPLDFRISYCSKLLKCSAGVVPWCLPNFRVISQFQTHLALQEWCHGVCQISEWSHNFKLTLLWTPNLHYRIPATVLQILPLVANLWGCRWDKFVLFIFHFRLLFTLFVLFQVLMPACLSLLSIVWNKCARHAGSGQCFRPALFWRQHTRLGVQFLGCHGMWP